MTADDDEEHRRDHRLEASARADAAEQATNHPIVQRVIDEMMDNLHTDNTLVRYGLLKVAQYAACLRSTANPAHPMTTYEPEPLPDDAYAEHNRSGRRRWWWRAVAYLKEHVATW